ncbi:MAG: 8-amino-7-oxononanoate synthase [Fuerstiella sp.]
MSRVNLLKRIGQRLQNLEQQGRRRVARVVDSHADGSCDIDGCRLVNFGSNDYLGLAHQAGTVFRETRAGQLGATASALVTGRTAAHARLEETLASFEQTEAALLFPTGFAANLGVLNSLVETNDAVFCDRDNHASIIDAARASAGTMLVYRRERLEALAGSLRRRRSRFEHVFIVTDGVFSMDGTVAPLPELCDLAEQYDASIIVDEAHGTGVLGTSGRGACDACGVEDRILLRVGTMSKAMGGLGGFAVADQPVIELLRNTARTQFFSTALPPVICDAMVESLNVIRSEPQRRSRLAELGADFRRCLAEAGLPSIDNGVAPIIPVLIPGERAVVQLAERLQTDGFFVPAIRTPTVRSGTERLRVSFGTCHTADQLKTLCAALIQHTNAVL